MKRARPGYAILLLILSHLALFGAGKKETPLTEASGGRNWEKVFDISDKKPGVYNIVVEGKDQAGNVTLAGPINVFIDPKTDFPVAAVANPLPGMRVSGDLNVVGTCVDDDGVAKIELRLDGGEWFDAQGGSFWSFYFKGRDITDGRHTLSVRGVDVNGLAGPESSVSFDMDKRRPVETVESPSAGALVAGRVALRGSVFDANGIESVSFSLDGGKTFVPVNGPYDRKTGIRSFVADIDTRKMPDGPSVAWLKSADGVGSVGLAPVLLVVDNTKPTIDLISPAPEEPVDGSFTLIGYARDEVGLKSISWKIGELGGDIPVKPGDPFFSIPVKLAAPRGKETTLVLSAGDTIGNKTETRRRLLLDLEADKPRATLLSPVPRVPGVTAANDISRSEGSTLLAGFARDDDGIAAVEYWVDSGKPERIDTTGAFSVRLSDLPPGKRVLSVRAIDLNGTAGPVVSASVEEIGAPPSIGISELIRDYGGKEQRAETFQGGADALPDGKAAFRFAVKHASYAGSRISSADWTLSGPGGAGALNGTVRVGSDGSALLPLPKETPFGILTLSVSVKDSFGRSASASGLVRVVDYSAVRGDPSFVFADERLDGEGVLRFAAAGPGRRPFSGRFVGAALASVRLEPESASYELAVDGPFVSVAPRGDGANGSFTLVAKTDRGHEFRSRTFQFRSDITGPRLAPDAQPSLFVGSAAVLSGSVSDPGGVESVSCTIGSSADLIAVPVDSSGRFSAKLDLSAVPDGPVRVTLKAADRVGNESVVSLDWMKDAEAPTIDFISGSSGETPAGFAAGAVQDKGGVASLSFAADGVSFVPLDDREAFVVRCDPASAARARLKAVDRAGNERVAELPATPTAPAAETTPGPTEAHAAPSTVEPAAAPTASSTEDSNATPAEAPPSGAPSPVAAAVPDEKALPSLSILFPAPDAPTTGTTPVVFALSSPRAVGGIRWTFGQASGELDPSLLVPRGESSSVDRGGEFVCAFIAKGIAARAGSPQLWIQVKDGSGKSASASVSVKAEPERLNPQLSVQSPGEDETAKGSLVVSASAAAERGIASYRFSLDGAEARTVESAGIGLLSLEGLAPGRHSLSVVAVDSFGLESVPVRRSFRVVGDAPSLSLSEGFRPGAALVVDSTTRIEGRAEAPNGLYGVSLSLPGREPVWARVSKESGSAYAFSVALPQNLPFEKTEFTLKAQDSAGLSTETSSFLYRVAAAPASGVYEAPGLYASDPRLPASAETPIRIADSEPMRLRFIGRPLASVALDPPREGLSASIDGSSVVFAALSDGTFGPTSVKARDVDGDEFSWGPYSFAVCRSDPVLDLAEPRGDGWYQVSAPVEASASSAAGLPRLTFSLDGVDWRPFPDAAADPATGKTRSPALPLDAPDGGILLRFRAESVSGRAVAAERVVNKDTAAPSGTVVAPRPTDAVNGRTTIAARFADSGKLASVEFSVDGENWEKAETPEAVSRQVDFSASRTPTPRFRAVDAAGNVFTLDREFNPDVAADKPRTLVQLPQEGEVVRADFSVSGAAFDDDGVAAVHYRLDGGEWVRLPLEGNGFSIPVDFSGAADNEHRVEVYAEDIYGVIGEIAARGYRVSREEPKAAIAEPKLESTVRGVVEIRGGATDANGIGTVELSFDNAVGYNRAVLEKTEDQGASAWKYRLDTRILKDGLHSVYVRPRDAYGTDGFFASLLSVDNTPPELTLDLPLDGETADGKIMLSGRAADARGLGSLFVDIYPLSASGSPERRFALDQAETVISKGLDLGAFADGSYGLRLVAVDKAGNQTTVTRDFSIKAGSRVEYISLASPVAGERLSGMFRVQGRVKSPARVSSVSVIVDGADFVSAVPDKNGWFSADLSGVGERPLGAGSHVLEVRFVNDQGKVVASGPVDIEFNGEGPWTLADSFMPGSYVPYRPYLSGTAGWTSAEAPAPADAAAVRRSAEERRGREVLSVEVSVDNGRTFAPASGRSKWRYRLETQNFSEGSLPVIVRARFRNGEIAASKLYLNLDKTPPKVSIISPGEAGRFNGKISVSGIASDDVELSSVSLALRDGDKAGYELPSFIQGMYLDAHLFGEPTYEVGAGFTFFGDNVKLQFAYGFTPETFLGQDRGRFHGNVLSAKLLANIFSFPFAFWLGPDWEFLSANLAVGANFSYFSETQSTSIGESSGIVIGAVVTQIEFPKLKFKNWAMFRSYSFYLEGQAWFVSAELDGGIKPSITMGLRVGIF